MSRHQLPANNPAHEVFIGWDRPLRNFWGQVFDPSLPDSAPTEVIDGWPTRDGLIPFNAPEITSVVVANQKINELFQWVKTVSPVSTKTLMKIRQELIVEFRLRDSPEVQRINKDWREYSEHHA
jgi:hypothetical protein